MPRLLPALAALGFAAISAAPANAGPDFGYVYTAHTEEAGETEVTLWATDRRGKAGGNYAAQDYRVEVERGISDRFQVSGYVDLASHHIDGFAGELKPVDRNFAFQGLSAEFKYQLRSPDHDRLGIALYAEPGWARIQKVTGEKADEYELELKAIVQKNFAHDRLTWATNLTVEPEWEREHEEIAPGVTNSETEKELAIELSSGVSYNIAGHWWVGAEGRYHSVYPDWTHGLHRENYAIYAGPSVHYEAGEWAFTATWQPQLTGAPSPGGRGLEYDDHEKREFRLKISKEF